MRRLNWKHCLGLADGRRPWPVHQRVGKRFPQGCSLRPIHPGGLVNLSERSKIERLKASTARRERAEPRQAVLQRNESDPATVVTSGTCLVFARSPIFRAWSSLNSLVMSPASDSLGPVLGETAAGDEACSSPECVRGLSLSRVSQQAKSQVSCCPSRNLFACTLRIGSHLVHPQSRSSQHDLTCSEQKMKRWLRGPRWVRPTGGRRDAR